MNNISNNYGSNFIIFALICFVLTNTAYSAPFDRKLSQQQKRIIVVGDSLADGLYAGLYRLAKKNKFISVKKKTKINTGLVRNDKHDWISTVDKIASSRKYDIAVVSFGANDLVSFRSKKGSIHFGAEKWPEFYAQKVSELITLFKSAGMEVVWVGLPITNRSRFIKGYKTLNSIYQEQANSSHIRFVDTWSALSKDGKYHSFGKGPRGKRIQIRHNDGVHFTSLGYISYAKIVADNFLPNGWQSEKY